MSKSILVYHSIYDTEILSYVLSLIILIGDMDYDYIRYLNLGIVTGIRTHYMQ